MTEPPLDRPGVVIRIPMRYSPRQSKRPPSPQDHPDAIVCQRARLPTTPEYQVKKLTRAQASVRTMINTCECGGKPFFNREIVAQVTPRSNHGSTVVRMVAGG